MSRACEVYIHPASALYQRNPEWLVYHELARGAYRLKVEIRGLNQQGVPARVLHRLGLGRVELSGNEDRVATEIEPQWLPELAPNLFQRADPTKLSKRKMRERIEPGCPKNCCLRLVSGG